MNRTYRLIILAISLVLALTASISAAPGDLDSTFGNGGIVITRGINGNYLSTAWAMAIQPDGKIVVVGEGNDGPFFSVDWDFVVVRYNTDGSLDSSFGSNGRVVTQLSAEYDGAHAVAFQTDGKIVVAGSTCNSPCTGSSVAVVRYNPDGSLDTSFNGTGIVSTAVGNSGGTSDLAIQADGKIVVVRNNFAVLRYNADGSLDTSFNSSGKVITPVGYASSVSIQADGKIVVGGQSGGILDYSFAIVRYNPDGSLDTSFNGTGNVNTSVGNAGSSIRDLAIQTDGKIVVAGDSVNASADTLNFAIVRYNTNGSLDTSFGGTGKILIPDSDSVDYARSVAIQSNGKIVVAGESVNKGSDFTVGGSDFELVRLNPNGSLDTSFNGTGTVITSVGNAWDHASSVAIQADGKIVVAGDTGRDDFKDFVVVRYQGDSATPPPTPTPTPTATPTPTPVPTPTATPTPAPSLRANGKIVFTSDRDGNREIYVMDADGTNQVRLTNNSGLDDHPRWSPDGTKIAFVSQLASAGFAIFIMNADGTNKVEVTPISYEQTPITWSPEGNRIAFSDVGHIAVVDINGSNRRSLTNLTNSQEWDVDPSWSPDGSRILFSHGSGSVLHTIKPDGTDLRALPSGQADGFGDFSPSWSPAGDKIIFVVNVWDFDYALFTADADGTNRKFFDGCATIFDHCRTVHGNPNWSPDGRKIIFSFWANWNPLDTGDEIYVKKLDGSALTQLTNTAGSNFNPSWQPLPLTIPPSPSQIDDPQFFIRQHYRDFLNRDPDSSGLTFWINEMISCGNDAACSEVKRINVSASFFLSIEFQETGYLVYRINQTAHGNLPGTPVPIRYEEFLRDTEEIGRGVIVNQPGWQTVLANNKQAFVNEFVQRAQFTSAYPDYLAPAPFIDALFANADVTPTEAERAAAINEFGSAATTSDAAARARALLDVAEHPDLIQQEFNRAFVLMEYFGYLRRNPNDAPDGNFDGYNFWLTKLNQFDGNFINAEMVKAFITSTEYRQRFGP